MVISNCEITKQDSEVLRPCVISTQSPLYKETKQLFPSIDITGSDIYAAYSGTVVLLNRDDLGQCMIIQTETSFCITYKHLDNVAVRLGDYVDKGQFIGSVDKYIRIELLRNLTSIWAVRIGAATWYKQDPQPIFDHTLSATPNINLSNLHVTVNPPKGTGVYNNVEDGQILYILTDNKGD